MIEKNKPGKLIAVLLGIIETVALFLAGIALYAMGGDSLDKMISAFLFLAGLPAAIIIGIFLGLRFGRRLSPWGFARPRQVIISICAAVLIFGLNSLFLKAGVFKKPVPLENKFLAATPDELIKTLHDNDPYKRINSAEELIRRNYPQAVDLLLPILKDSEPFVRSRVIILLGQLRDKRTVEPIINALDDTDFGVRLDAVRSLGTIGDEQAVEPLLNLLNSQYFGGIISEALAGIKSRRAVEPLINFLEKMNREDQIKDSNRVISSLAKITGQNFGSDVKRWREWYEAEKKK